MVMAGRKMQSSLSRARRSAAGSAPAGWTCGSGPDSSLSERLIGGEYWRSILPRADEVGVEREGKRVTRSVRRPTVHLCPRQPPCGPTDLCRVLPTWSPVILTRERKDLLVSFGARLLILGSNPAPAGLRTPAACHSAAGAPLSGKGLPGREGAPR